MARLRIVELPMTGYGDNVTTPFVVVLDQVGELSPFNTTAYAERLGESAKVWGGRGALVTTDTIELAGELPPAEVEAVKIGGTFDVDPDWRARQLEGQLKEFAEAQYRENLDHMDAVTEALGFDRLRDWGEIVSAIKLQRRMDAEGGHLFGEPGFRDPLRCARCRIFHTDWVRRGARCEAVRAENGGE
ncbi:hypothetical protein [Streptomyces europaeiscabiei]|uniref:hypothetical protein n=1 Tax=Streptomyces europaeiscabiei TaxID=146819 RepID=UPI002E18D361